MQTPYSVHFFVKSSRALVDCSSSASICILSTSPCHCQLYLVGDKVHLVSDNDDNLHFASDELQIVSDKVHFDAKTHD